MTHALGFLTLGVVFVTSVHLATAKLRISEEDASETKTPTVVAPYVSRKLLTWISEWPYGGSPGPFPDMGRTDKERPSEEKNATRSSKYPSIEGSFWEKIAACNIMSKTGPRREKKRKPPKDAEDDDEEFNQSQRQRRRGSSQKFRNRNKQTNREVNRTEVQQEPKRIKNSQGRQKGKSSPQGSRERSSTSKQKTTGPALGEGDDL